MQPPAAEAAASDSNTDTSPWTMEDTRQVGIALALSIGLAAAAALRLNYALSQSDFLWYDSTQYVAVAMHPFFSLGLWSGSQPPLVPLMWKLTRSPTRFAILQTIIAVGSWSFLAWTVWTWLGRTIRATAGAWVILAFSLSPFVIQWDASVLSESVSLSMIAVGIACGITLAQRFTWTVAIGLAVAGLVFALARDEGIEVIAVIGVGFAVGAVICAVRHHRQMAIRGAVIAALLLATTGILSLAADHAQRNVLNVENSLYVRVFPYPNMVAAFAAHGMPEAKRIDAVAKILDRREGTPYAYASPPPSSKVALVVGPIIAEPYWAPLRHWIAAHGATTYLEYLATHPGYVLTAPFHRPPLAFNSPPSLSFYQIHGHALIPGMSLFFPRRIFVIILGLVAAALLLWRRNWRRWDVAVVASLIPLGVFAMAVGWFGDGQEISRHLIEGNVMARLGVLLLFLWGALAPSRAARAERVDGEATDVKTVSAVP